MTYLLIYTRIIIRVSRLRVNKNNQNQDCIRSMKYKIVCFNVRVFSLISLK